MGVLGPASNNQNTAAQQPPIERPDKRDRAIDVKNLLWSATLMVTVHTDRGSSNVLQSIGDDRALPHEIMNTHHGRRPKG